MTGQTEIVHEGHKHFAVRLPSGKGFEVYRNEATAAVRCARIGFKGQAGLDRAIAEIGRREA